MEFGSTGASENLCRTKTTLDIDLKFCRDIISIDLCTKLKIEKVFFEYRTNPLSTASSNPDYTQKKIHYFVTKNKLGLFLVNEKNKSGKNNNVFI